MYKVYTRRNLGKAAINTKFGEKVLVYSHTNYNHIVSWIARPETPTDHVFIIIKDKFEEKWVYNQIWKKSKFKQCLDCDGNVTGNMCYPVHKQL